MKQFIVHSHDSDGNDYAAEFDYKKDALNHILADLDTVEQNYEYDQREYEVLRNNHSATIYVPNTDIYCEWKIYEYGKESISDYIKYLDGEELKVEQELLDVETGIMNFDYLPDDIRLAYENWLMMEAE